MTLTETKRTFDAVYEAVNSGRSINEAFALVAAEYGRSVGSVRNYYYAQLRFMRMLPEVGEKLGLRDCERVKRFDRFSRAEIDELLEDVLTKRASGRSVRSILIERACGDDKKYVREQNKYRALVTKKRKEVYEAISKLAAQKRTHYNPFTKKIMRFEALPRKSAASQPNNERKP